MPCRNCSGRASTRQFPIVYAVTESRAGETRMSKLWAERFTAMGMIVVAGFFLLQSIDLPGTSGSFPQFTEYVVILLALTMIVRTFFTHDERFAGDVRFDFSYAAMKPIYVMIVTIFYAYAVFRLGFYAASVIFFFIVTWMTGYRNWKVMGAVAVVLFPLMYLFFNIALEADLPKGLFI
jgi:hypothetical protein